MHSVSDFFTNLSVTGSHKSSIYFFIFYFQCIEEEPVMKEGSPIDAQMSGILCILQNAYINDMQILELTMIIKGKRREKKKKTPF